MKISEAGKLFLNDARRILQEVNDATARAERIAFGLAGTLRMGFVQSMSWRGIVPDSFRRFRELQPDAELQLNHQAPRNSFRYSIRFFGRGLRFCSTKYRPRVGAVPNRLPEFGFGGSHGTRTHETEETSVERFD